MNWGETEIARLRELAGHKDKLSASQIAAHFPGVSRSAIIGKCSRCGIPLQGRAKKTSGPRKPRQPYVSPRRFHTSKPEAKPMPEPIQLAFADVTPLNINLYNLKPGQCRYPYGDGPFVFCGHPVEGERSCCPAHHRLTHTKAMEYSRDELERRRRQGRENFRSVRVA